MVIILLCLLSTAYELLKKGPKSKKNLNHPPSPISNLNSPHILDDWLTAFSLYKNVSSIITLERDAGEIKVANGIRVINFFVLLVAHKGMCVAYFATINKAQMSEQMAMPYAIIARSAVLYTDTYLMLSGMLTAYSLFGRYKRGQKIKLFQEYMGRYIR